MIFSWDDRNRDHIAKHGVRPPEAEFVVEHAEPPFPETIEGDKFVVWGPTEADRYLQVIYVLKAPADIAYESVAALDWMEIESGGIEKIARIIHAMELTQRMKKRLRKRRR
jgi:uncharacterized DUF497 family protein